MIARRTQQIFIIILVTILFLPLIIYLREPVKSVSQSENRKYASRPELNLQSFFAGSFRSDFEEYWNDHFGLREKLISLHAHITKRVFRKTPFKKVIIGKDDWLFLNTPSTASDLVQSFPLDENRLQSWAATLEDRQKWMEARNIHYVLLPIPNKMHVYTEYLPTKYHLFRSNDTRSNLQLLLDYLRENSTFTDVIDLRPTFRMERHNRRLYFKTDTHWTWEGAHIAYNRLNDTLRKWFPDRKNVGYDDLDYTEINKRGDLASLATIRPYVEEKSYVVTVKSQCAVQSFKLPGHNKKLTKRHPVVTLCDSAQNTAVVTYDSFGALLEPYYSSQFKKVTYVSRHDDKWLMSYLDRERPDVFIHQRVERNLPIILARDWGQTTVTETPE